MKTLLVALLLLAVGAGTAFAECAWVLWSELLVTGAAPLKEWQIGIAAPSQDACHTQMRRDIEARRAKTPREDIVESLSALDTFASRVGDQVFVRRYLCLPDTVDPRGPKGR